MELFIAVADRLGFHSDKDLASLADVGAENVPNWRNGAVKEFKKQKFRAVMRNLEGLLAELRERSGQAYQAGTELTQLEIESGSGPADLSRQFRERVAYDYLGHRFLYFEPQGALAWERLIKTGYEQEHWLEGIKQCAQEWFDTGRDMSGRAKGPIAQALGLNRRDRPCGIDVISLGPGEGGKEVIILRALLAAEKASKMRSAWLTFAPVDVSIMLLVAAAQSSRELLLAAPAGGKHETSIAYRSVLPFVGDFEEGRLAFLERLKTSKETGSDGLRLVLLLGNIFGNLRDEETFVRHKLRRIARPGDLVWIEIGIRPESIEDEPLFRRTVSNGSETAADANRRLLLEGPYRRWASAIGRQSPQLKLRIWGREDDESARIPGSFNFCHDLVIAEESRFCTMLYSRRYRLTELKKWFEGLDFTVQHIRIVKDSKGRDRVAHFLLARNR